MKGTGTNRGVHREQPREGWAGPAGGGQWLVERQGTEEERRDESRRGRHECLRHVDQPSASKNVETPGVPTSGDAARTSARATSRRQRLSDLVVHCKAEAMGFHLAVD